MVQLGGYSSREELLNQHALRKVIDPEEVAALVSFLASDASSAISGTIISIDGGACARSGDFLGVPPFPVRRGIRPGSLASRNPTVRPARCGPRPCPTAIPVTGQCSGGRCLRKRTMPRAALRSCPASSMSAKLRWVCLRLRGRPNPKRIVASLFTSARQARHQRTVTPRQLDVRRLDSVNAPAAAGSSVVFGREPVAPDLLSHESVTDALGSCRPTRPPAARVPR
jgi:hypothetical protein